MLTMLLRRPTVILRRQHFSSNGLSRTTRCRHHLPTRDGIPAWKEYRLRRPSELRNRCLPPRVRKVQFLSASRQLIKVEQAVRNFFTPASQKPKDEKLAWRTVNSSLIVGRYNPTLPEAAVSTGNSEPIKIAAFDFVSKASSFAHAV
jgi:hypothetical protein